MPWWAIIGVTNRASTWPRGDVDAAVLEGDGTKAIFLALSGKRDAAAEGCGTPIPDMTTAFMLVHLRILRNRSFYLI
jgi:hypothetical protein